VREVEAQADRRGKELIRRQVSRVCPNCRAAASKRARPQKFFTVTPEQECLACGTRYSKPTPVELAVAAVLVSVPVLVLGLGITVSAAEAVLDRIWPLALALGATAAFCLWICTSALIEGINAFFEVRVELAPQGFTVLPKEPGPGASERSTSHNTSSCDNPPVRPIKAEEMRP
jgi:uncharacterized protein (DUF983 family)